MRVLKTVTLIWKKRYFSHNNIRNLIRTSLFYIFRNELFFFFKEYWLFFILFLGTFQIFKYVFQLRYHRIIPAKIIIILIFFKMPNIVCVSHGRFNDSLRLILIHLIILFCKIISIFYIIDKHFNRILTFKGHCLTYSTKIIMLTRLLKPSDGGMGFLIIGKLLLA
jgi:hypothetical protein